MLTIVYFCAKTRMRNFVASLAALLLLVACGGPTLSQLEDEYAANPTPETAEALKQGYLEKLSAADAEGNLSPREKLGLLQIKTEDTEGLGSNLQTLLTTAGEHPAASVVANSLLDSLLYNMTGSDNRLKSNMALQYIITASNYANTMPQDEHTPDLLYKAAELARSIGSYDRALAIYGDIEKNYPSFEKAPTALFMQGFIYSEDLGNEDAARTLYEQFIAKYPENDFADDAEMLLQTLGKTDEEIFQEILQNQQNES